MKFLMSILLFGLVLIFCWPLALLLLFAVPFLWLLLLPFRLAFTVVEAILALVRALLFLPARLLEG